MRLIDADALINDILTDYGCDPKYIADETIDGLKPYTDQLILERIGLQPTIAAPRWVRCEERLPEDGEWAIFTNGKVVTVERFKLDAYNHFYPPSQWFDFDDAKYWMHLPEPPKDDA